MVPPLPQDAIDAVIAGTSSMNAEPPAVGVHAARGIRTESAYLETLDDRTLLTAKREKVAMIEVICIMELNRVSIRKTQKSNTFWHK